MSPAVCSQSPLTTVSRRSGSSAGFSLEAKSDKVEECNFSVKADDGSIAKVFGIEGPDDHHGPMKRPGDKQPPSGWTDNSFDDSSWGIPDGTKVQYSCWYQRKKYTFWRVGPGGGGPSLTALASSKAPECVKLVEALIAASPGVVASTIVISACAKPPAFELALKLLDAYPKAVLDEAAVAPLLEENNKNLKSLVLKAECHQLVDALLARAPTLKLAVFSSETLRGVLSPAEIWLTQRFLESEGGDALAVALKEATAKD